MDWVETQIGDKQLNEPVIAFKLSSNEDQAVFNTTDNTPTTKASIQNAFPDAIVVQSESELPTAIQDEIKQQKAGGKIKGVHYQNNVYMVANNIATMGQAIGTYRHEQLGHEGVINELGVALDSYAIALVNNATETQKTILGRIAKEYVGTSNLTNLTNAQRSTIGQEYIAKIAEAPTNKPTAFVKLKFAIKKALRKAGVPSAIIQNISNAEIQALISKVEQKQNKLNAKANSQLANRVTPIAKQDYKKLIS